MWRREWLLEARTTNIRCDGGQVKWCYDKVGVFFSVLIHGSKYFQECVNKTKYTRSKRTKRNENATCSWNDSFQTKRQFGSFGRFWEISQLFGTWSRTVGVFLRTRPINRIFLSSTPTCPFQEPSMTNPTLFFVGIKSSPCVPPENHPEVTIVEWSKQQTAEYHR